MIENRETFINRISGLDRESNLMIMDAYDMAKCAHGHMRQVREGNGQRYFEHPRYVALILMDELEIFDTNLLCAGLLHDVAEDTVLLGNRRDGTYRDWREVVMWRTSRPFNLDVARMVLDVTKPYIDGVEITTEEEGLELYFKNLRNAQPDSIIVKMSDRLHNLRAMDGVEPEKRVRKVQETIETYYDIFKRGVGYSDGRAFAILDQKIRDEVERLKFI